jgi:hypothetical protein
MIDRQAGTSLPGPCQRGDADPVVTSPSGPPLIVAVVPLRGRSSGSGSTSSGIRSMVRSMTTLETTGRVPHIHAGPAALSEPVAGDSAVCDA